jgi:hypothetical protein
VVRSTVEGSGVAREVEANFALRIDSDKFLCKNV